MLRCAVAVALLVAACSSSSEPPKPTAAAPARMKDPAAARKLIGAGAVVLDVRSADEYGAGHLPNATNIPVDELAGRLDEVAKLTGGDLKKPVVVYCASGHRAGKAQQVLDGAGYAQVVNGGGLDDLQ
jgi:phage shock protein E